MKNPLGNAIVLGRYNVMLYWKLSSVTFLYPDTIFEDFSCYLTLKNIKNENIGIYDFIFVSYMVSSRSGPVNWLGSDLKYICQVYTKYIE